MQSAARYAGASDAMLAIGAFAAVCTLLAAPAAPLGVPRNMLVGHAVSVGVALVVHWTSAPLEQLFGISMLEVRKVLVPSLAIALQMKVGAVKPPAAAAAEIFTSDPRRAAPAAVVRRRTSRSRRRSSARRGQMLVQYATIAHGEASRRGATAPAAAAARPRRSRR